MQPKKYRPGTKALREIRAYQKGTELLVQVCIFKLIKSNEFIPISVTISESPIPTLSSWSHRFSYRFNFKVFALSKTNVFCLFFFKFVFVSRFTADALECLQTASEAFIIQVFEDSVLAMIHAKRVTLMIRDIQFIRRLRGI